jgi:hypothetical protein
MIHSVPRMAREYTAGHLPGAGGARLARERRQALAGPSAMVVVAGGSTSS